MILGGLVVRAPTESEATAIENETGLPARSFAAIRCASVGGSAEQPSNVVFGERSREGAVCVHHVGEQRGLPLLELHDLLLDGADRDVAVDHDRVALADAVGAVDCLCFDGWVPPRVEHEAVVGLGQVQAEPARFEADDEHGTWPSLNLAIASSRLRVRPSRYE